MKALLFELSAAEGLAEQLCRRLDCERGELDRRQFPDTESYVRLTTNVDGRAVILLCTLDRPDAKALPLLFTAAAARAQGACSVGLVAPYLAYMRQDMAFRLGEAVTSRTFAEILSAHFDWLVTVDPHLHRFESLGAIYSMPAIAASAAETIGRWVRSEVQQPVVIGPDEESAQWAKEVGRIASAEVIVLGKRRRGDFEVSIDDAALGHLATGFPVIIDDIASTAQTMIETLKLLRKHVRTPPICAVVHPIFAADAYERLTAAGVTRIVSTNSIAHESNAMDISATLANAVAIALDRVPA